MKIRYLPPGSLKAEFRRGRMHGRVEGAIGVLTILAILSVALIAMTPTELYRPAHPSQTHERGEALKFVRVPLPPCADMSAKDCTPVADPFPRSAVVHSVPEPESVSLVLIGLLAAARRRIVDWVMQAQAMLWITAGRALGMEEDDE